ncbi:MAG: DUF2617 family protein [Planctomycetota bacterium]
MLSARPKIAELSMQLYGRALHPELFEAHASKRVERVPPDARGAGADRATVLERGGYDARVQITRDGHVVTWRYGGLTLTEVAASSHQPLPQKRRLMSQRVGAEATEAVRCRGGVTYEVTFALESATPEALAAYGREFELMALQTSQSELASDADAAPTGLLHRFQSSGRSGVTLDAVSYVDVQARDRSLRVRAIHTFPDDHAIVRSESHFRLP